MDTVYFSLTARGDQLARMLAEGCPGEVVTKDSLAAAQETFAQAVARRWKDARALVFIMASGIAVRTIAPLLSSKTQDPAVVVMDAAGRFAVSLVSGHLGGANALAQRLARLSGGQPVITTGTDVVGTLAFDVFAKEQGMLIENIRALKHVSSAMIQREPVAVYASWPLEAVFPDNVTVYPAHAAGGRPRHTVAVFIGHDYDAFEGAKPSGGALAQDDSVLRLRPKNLLIGVGCRRGVGCECMAEAFGDFLKKNQIRVREVAGIATVALKKDEPAILALCKRYGLRLRIIGTSDIAALEAEGAVSSSDFVRSVTGVGSVCEGAAVAAARQAGREARLVCPKTKYTGITFALAEHMPVLHKTASGYGEESFGPDMDRKVHDQHEYTADWHQP